MGLVAITYVLLVVGASVRVHGAGLACPDWPLCFGVLIPEIDFLVGLEFGHRVYAGGVSLLFVWLGYRLWKERESLSPDVLRWWWVAAVALFTQVILGGLTVLELLAQWTVSSHLLVGNTFCALIWLLALRLKDQGREDPRPPLPTFFRGWTLVLGLLLVGQLVLGGWVSSSMAGRVCGTTWPDCAGLGWFPLGHADWRVALHSLHRLMAVGLLVVAIVGAFVARPHASIRRLFGWMLLGILCQAGLGVANVWLAVPAEITLAHTGGAAATVLLLTTCLHEVWMAPTPSGALNPPRTAGEGT